MKQKNNNRLLEIHGCPGNPLLDLLVLKSLVNELDDGIRFLLAQQEPVDESVRAYPE